MLVDDYYTLSKELFSTKYKSESLYSFACKMLDPEDVQSIYITAFFRYRDGLSLDYAYKYVRSQIRKEAPYYSMEDIDTIDLPLETETDFYLYDSIPFSGIQHSICCDLLAGYSYSDISLSLCISERRVSSEVSRMQTYLLTLPENRSLRDRIDNIRLALQSLYNQKPHS